MVTLPTEKSTTCTNCSVSFTYQPCEFEGRELFTPDMCDPCFKILSTKRAEEQAKLEAEAAKAAQVEVWEKICPPLYRDTDPKGISEVCRRAAKDWMLSPMGLGLIGSAGAGKTRAAFLILKRLHFTGTKIAAVSHTRFAKYCRDQFSDNQDVKFEATKALNNFRSVSVLLLDDLGKAKDTDRAGEELHDLLEHRTSHRLPTIWTANANAEQLSALISTDRADAVLRRLSEFSEVKKV